MVKKESLKFNGTYKMNIILPPETIMRGSKYRKANVFINFKHIRNINATQMIRKNFRRIYVATIL